MEGSISGAAQQQHQQQQQTRRINRDRLLQLIIIVSLGRRGHIHGRQGRARLGRRQSCNIIVDIAGSHQQPHTHHRSSPWPPTTSLSLSRLIFSIVLPLSLILLLLSCQPLPCRYNTHLYSSVAFCWVGWTTRTTATMTTTKQINRPPPGDYKEHLPATVTHRSPLLLGGLGAVFFLRDAQPSLNICCTRIVDKSAPRHKTVHHHHHPATNHLSYYCWSSSLSKSGNLQRLKLSRIRSAAPPTTRRAP